MLHRLLTSWLQTMKPSPLLLDTPAYPIISIQADPEAEESSFENPLWVDIFASVRYNSNGSNFAFLNITQKKGGLPYKLDVQVFTTFRIDTEGCQQAYKKAFNPQVVAVNVARILYSGAREFIALISSRAPHGSANLPSIMIEPGDVRIEFEKDQIEGILSQQFSLSKETIEEILSQPREGAEEIPAQQAIAAAKKKTSPRKKS